jgi:signal transduction histidine kinase
MMGYLEMIEDSIDLDDVGVATEFKVVQRNGRRLLELISDLLITTDGLPPLNRISADIAGIGADVTERALHYAAVAGVVLTFSSDPPDPRTRPRDPGSDPAGSARAAAGALVAEIDPALIADLFDKLLSNAIKFTRQGGTVSLDVARDGDEAVIRVADTGIGILPDDVVHMFEPFFRGTTARTMVSPGAGLGLSIAQVIVVAHGGTIGTTSVRGEGTTVEVRLPLSPG